MEKMCSLCKKSVDSESAAILTMGGFGNPKYICTECENALDVVTRGRDYYKIKNAMAEIGKKIESNNVDDEQVVETVNEIFTSSMERAENIKNGTYDFSADNNASNNDDVPEELKETEEDRLLDEAEKIESEKSQKNFDRYVFYPGLIGAGIALIFFIVKRFFLN